MKMIKNLTKLIAMVSILTMLLGTTVFADTYSYEDYTRVAGGFYVDHYHGDTVSVLLYEFAQDDVSIAGITCDYKFYCVGGNTFVLDADTTEYEGDMWFTYQSIDAEPIDYIDRNPINVWEFSIKPGTYDFSYVNTQGIDGQWNTLNSDFTVFPQPGQEYGDEITVEAGDTVRVYIWHQGYIDGDSTNGAGEKDKAFRAEYLPKFQEWAKENEKNVQERMQQSAGPEEVISVTVESSEEGEGQAIGSSDPEGSSAVGSGDAQESIEASSGLTETVVNTPSQEETQTPETVEEKKSIPLGTILGGIGALLVLIIVGFVFTKKK